MLLCKLVQSLLSPRWVLLGHVYAVAVPERDLCLSLLLRSQIALLKLCQAIWKVYDVQVPISQTRPVDRTSRALLGNIFTLFQSLWILRWTMFATFKYLSRGSILEIITSGVMFEHREAMLVR